VIHVARRIAAELEEADIVCLLADGGWKYLSTDAWNAELEQAEKAVSESLWW
jgi:cysteine synthase B